MHDEIAGRGLIAKAEDALREEVNFVRTVLPLNKERAAGADCVARISCRIVSQEHQAVYQLVDSDRLDGIYRRRLMPSDGAARSSTTVVDAKSRQLEQRRIIELSRHCSRAMVAPIVWRNAYALLVDRNQDVARPERNGARVKAH